MALLEAGTASVTCASSIVGLAKVNCSTPLASRPLIDPSAFGRNELAPVSIPNARRPDAEGAAAVSRRHQTVVDFLPRARGVPVVEGGAADDLADAPFRFAI